VSRLRGSARAVLTFVVGVAFAAIGVLMFVFGPTTERPMAAAVAALGAAAVVSTRLVSPVRVDLGQIALTSHQAGGHTIIGVRLPINQHRLRLAAIGCGLFAAGCAGLAAAALFSEPARRDTGMLVIGVLGTGIFLYATATAVRRLRTAGGGLILAPSGLVDSSARPDDLIEWDNIAAVWGHTVHSTEYVTLALRDVSVIVDSVAGMAAASLARSIAGGEMSLSPSLLGTDSQTLVRLIEHFRVSGAARQELSSQTGVERVRAILRR
jgi:hypothetical protein